MAVLTVARILEIPDAMSYQSLSNYEGSWRRFEIKEGRGANGKFIIISDYAHHPTEILATLKAVREKYPDKKIWCIFQPHQYQRTFYLLKDFIKVLRQVNIDKIIVTDIYDVAGREEKNINEKVNSQVLVEKIKRKNVVYMDKESAYTFAKEHVKEGQVLVIMGAGDIYKLVDRF